MAVRVWGVVDDRLVELRAEPAADRGSGMRIEGLPGGRGRTTADRVRAALLNSGVAQEAPDVGIRLEPAVSSGPTSELDLAIALTALTWLGGIGAELRWILATGRLGLDGTVHQRGVLEPPTLSEVVESLRCHTPLLGFEHTFEGGK